MDQERKYKQLANLTTCTLLFSAGNTRKVIVLSVACGLKVQPSSEGDPESGQTFSTELESICVSSGGFVSLLTIETNNVPHGKTQLETYRYLRANILVPFSIDA